MAVKNVETVTTWECDFCNQNIETTGLNPFKRMTIEGQKNLSNIHGKFNYDVCNNCLLSTQIPKLMEIANEST